MTRTMLSPILVIVALLLVSSCRPKCDIENYLSSVQPLFNKFQEEVTVTSQIGPEMKMFIPLHVVNLVDIRSEAADLETPECVAEAHSNLLEYMSFTIDGYLALSEENNMQGALDNFRQGETYLDKYRTSIEALSHPSE